MKFFQQWLEDYKVNALIYESDNKNVYTYCPNCSREETIKKGKRTVKTIKETHIPICGCFDNKIPCSHNYGAKSGVKWYLSSGNIKLKERYLAGEFVRHKDYVVLNVYRISPTLASEEYNAFRRELDFDETLVGQAFYYFDGRIKYYTSCYKNMSTICFKNELVERKAFPIYFNFDFIVESLSQLDNTPFEKLKQILLEMPEFMSNITNKSLDEGVTAIMQALIKYPVVEKLYKSGFTELASHIVLEEFYKYKTVNPYHYYEYLNPRGASNRVIYRKAKSIKDALRQFDINILDKLVNRDEITVGHLMDIKKLITYKLAITRENLQIAEYSRFYDFVALLDRNNISLQKAFKYIRNQHKNVKHNAVGDYYDYLQECLILEFEFTNEVIYPTNLAQAHSRTSKAVKDANLVMKNEQFTIVVNKYKELDYKGERFNIELVESNQKLHDLSKKFQNCSYGYVDRIVCENCLIGIVYSAKNHRALSMFELDLANIKIVQNRRPKKNGGQPEATREVTEFTKKWLDEIVQPNIRRLQLTAKQAKQVA